MTVFPRKTSAFWQGWRKAAIFALTLAAADYGLCAQPPALVYVGTSGSELQALRFDADKGELSALGKAAQLSKSRWAVAHPRLPLLYAASDDGPGRLVAFAVNRETGALTQVGEVATGGNGPTHLWLDEPSMTLLVAHYGSGSVSSIALGQDGALGAVTASVRFTGSGPHKRQASAHAHGVAVSPDGRFALAPDLGSDRVFVQRFERERQALAASGEPGASAWAAPAGSGPRHLVFGRDGRFVYLVNELTAEVMALRWDAQAGQLSLVQTLPMSSEGFAGTKSGAEIALGADGRFLYVGNRSENSVMVYSIDAQSGELTLVQRAACGGDNPWTFALHPSGRWLLVANERSHTLNVLRIDESTGKLSDTGIAAASPAPISITILQ